MHCQFISHDLCWIGNPFGSQGEFATIDNIIYNTVKTVEYWGYAFANNKFDWYDKIIAILCSQEANV